MATPRAQWKARLVEKAMQIPQLEKILKHSRSSDFENWQRIILLGAFEEDQCPTEDERAELAKETELTQNQVTSWFQKRRTDTDDAAKMKMNEVDFTKFRLKGPPPTRKEEKELAAKFAKYEKRVQFHFDPSQIAILNESFDRNPNPTKKEREELRGKLGDVEYKQITYWFSNKRKRSQKFQEYWNQGKEEEDTDDEKPHSRSAFPPRACKILSEELNKCDRPDSKSIERIVKDTGLTKTQVQQYFINHRKRKTVKSSTPIVTKPTQNTKKRTIEYNVDEDGNVTFNLPADAFKKGAKITIQQGNTILHLNPKRRKMQVKAETEESDDEEESDQAGSSSPALVMKKSTGVSKQKSGKTKKTEKSLPNTTRHGYPTRKKTQVPSDTEETDDEEEEDQTPGVKKWSEYSKGKAETTKTPDQSDTEANFDDFNPSPVPSPRSPSQSAAKHGRREREDSITPSYGTDMAPESMDIDFDDFNHGSPPPARTPQYSPLPSETGIDSTPSEGSPDPAGMDIDDLSYISPPPSPELTETGLGHEDNNTSTLPPMEMDFVFDDVYGPTLLAAPAVSPIPRETEETVREPLIAPPTVFPIPSGPTGIDWEGERCARREEIARIEDEVALPAEEPETSGPSTPVKEAPPVLYDEDSDSEELDTSGSSTPIDESSLVMYQKDFDAVDKMIEEMIRRERRR